MDKKEEVTEEAKQTETSKIVEPEPEELDSLKNDEPTGKYQLLERLFKFVRTKDNTQVNSVLAGYFSKLVSLLIIRKQRSLIPYVFSPYSDVLDCLLNHVYQKSIAELLNKFLVI